MSPFLDWQLGVSKTQKSNSEHSGIYFCLWEWVDWSAKTCISSEQHYPARRATCRRKVIDGEEPREGDKPLSAAARMKSSIESERLGKRREEVRTKYCELDMRLELKRVGLTRKQNSLVWSSSGYLGWVIQQWEILTRSSLLVPLARARLALPADKSEIRRSRMRDDVWQIEDAYGEKGTERLEISEEVRERVVFRIDG